jgi:hypothetical protein
MRLSAAILTVALLCSPTLGRDFQLHLQLKSRTVYILPMANGLDRYIASRLTRSGVLRVVLDPERAYTVLTDRADEAFWAWSVACYGKAHGPYMSCSNDFAYSKLAHARWGDNRGTVFLVEPRGGLVLWSAYDPTQSTSPGALNDIAEGVAKRLAKSLDGK